jgi:FAD:protein FMN transferase
MIWIHGESIWLGEVRNLVYEITSRNPMNRPMQPTRLLVCLLFWCASAHAVAPATERLYRGEHAAMGTTWTILLYAPDAASGHAALEAAWDEVDRIDDMLSNYKPESELSRINRSATAGPVTTDPETFAFLQTAIRHSEISDGAFDITIGRLLRTWGFFDHNGKVPTEAERKADVSGVGWKHVQLNPATRTVQFIDSRGLELDPGSIGKGYAVDRVVKVLAGLGVTRAFVTAGSSSIYAMGAPPGKAGWNVEIPNPHAAAYPLATVLLRDRSLSTGACTEKFFVENRHRYCHIFDPRTLQPVEGMLQTTVITPLAIDSDALGTSVFVLTPQQSVRMLTTMPQVSALIVSAKGIEAIRWPTPIHNTSSTGEIP